MSQSVVTDSGDVLVVPGAYPAWTVAAGASGLAVSGIVFLVGEADAGPDFTAEADLTKNIYGPDQFSDVVAKYKSGQIVDAFRNASTPANDPNVTGAPTGFIIIKTNVSAKASSAILNLSSGPYATIYDKSSGALGNLIYYTITQLTAETPPSTGAYTFIPPVSSLNASYRIDGGTENAFTVTADMTPTAYVALLNGITSGIATGGAARTLLTVSGTIAAVASGTSLVITWSNTWVTTPVIGDTLVITSSSVLTGAANANDGAYVVTAATSSTVTAAKLSDAGKSGAVAGTVTAPVTVTSTAVLSTSDILDYSPVTIALPGSQVAGIGRDLEINELTSGVDLLSRTAYLLGTTTLVGWVSKTGAPKLLTAATEYGVNLNSNRQVDNVNEVDPIQGKVVLTIGYTGTSCSVVVDATTMTLTPVGGAGATLNINLLQYPTLGDLAAYINAQAGYNAAPATASTASTSTLALDEGTFTAATNFGNATLRLKADAVLWFNTINRTILLSQTTPATAGLPALVTSAVFLAGGARGFTTDAIYDSAIDALETLTGNFVVPLFSQNASSDIILGTTDPSSTYTGENIRQYAKTHVLKMSTRKRRKNRQAFVSIRDTFANAENAAGNLASYRVSCTFQDAKVTGSNGIIQSQPWMTAALAAGSQAAAFNKALVGKGINASGFIQAAGDYKYFDDSAITNALNAGLLPVKPGIGGGFVWASDQTTYSRDNNFVFNSIQAVYNADIVALTTAQRMEIAFVGASLADVNAGLGLAALESIMSDMLRLKLIAKSDDAPKGFKNAVITIKAPTMQVKAEIKLATALYFVPIDFTITPVVSSASG